MRFPSRALSPALGACSILAVLVSGCGKSAPTPIETTAPRVVATSPGDGEAGTSTTTQVTVTFSEPVDPGTVAILVDGLPRGELTVVDSVATLTLGHRLFQKVPYVVAVPAGVADLAGNSMPSDFIWSFTTGFSPLGEEWRIEPSPTAASLHGLVLGAGGFLAVGEAGTMLTSDDGTGWAPRTTLAYTGRLTSAFCIGDRWVVAGSPGALLASTGPDSWRQDELGGTISTLTDIWVGYDGIYMVGTSNDVPSSGIVIKYVSEGNWSRSDLGSERVPRSITRFGDEWIVVGDSGLIVTSTDGVSWADHSLSPGESFNKVRWDARGGVLFAVGRGVYTSTDGRLWVNRTPTLSARLSDIAWTEIHVSGTRHVLYCVVGDRGTVLTAESPDRWQLQNTGITSDLQAVASGQAPMRFVAVGEGGMIITSE